MSEGPFWSGWLEIVPEWIDYNGHLNMAYYSVLFDRAGDEAFAALGLGPDYARTRRHTTYTGEFHICYLRELKVGSRVRASFQLVDHDEKRIHCYQELFHEDGWLAATGESLALHINMAGPKVAPFPADIAGRIAAMAASHRLLPAPPRLSRSIAIRRADRG